MSEWPRSKFQTSAVRQRRNFGHRNRGIVPVAHAFKTPTVRAAARVDPTEEHKKCGRYRVSGVVEIIFFIGYILLPYSFYFIFLNFII